MGDDIKEMFRVPPGGGVVISNEVAADLTEQSISDLIVALREESAYKVFSYGRIVPPNWFIVTDRDDGPW